MLHHLTLVFASLGVIGVLAGTPLHLFWAGHPAVIFFFVLSGFVLSLPYYSNHEASYWTFVRRRVVRIYVPYAVAITVAIILESLFSRHGVPFLGGWFNMIWVDRLNPGLFFNHLFMIGDYKNYAYDPVIWSLIHEMRISLIFPLLMLVVKRAHWSLSLLTGIALSIFAMAYKGLVLQRIPFYADYGSAYTDSLHYMLMFIVGALLAKHRLFLVELVRKLRKTLKVAVLIAAVLLYTYGYWFPRGWSIMHLWIFEDWMIAVGAAMFIIMALASTRMSKVLLWRPIHFLGRMSYTLYLYHAICIMTLFNLLYGVIPTWIISATVIVSALLVSAFAYYAVEVPAIRWAHNIGSRQTASTAAGN